MDYVNGNWKPYAWDDYLLVHYISFENLGCEAVSVTVTEIIDIVSLSSHG